MRFRLLFGIDDVAEVDVVELAQIIKRMFEDKDYYMSNFRVMHVGNNITVHAWEE